MSSKFCILVSRLLVMLNKWWLSKIICHGCSGYPGFETVVHEWEFSAVNYPSNICEKMLAGCLIGIYWHGFQNVVILSIIEPWLEPRCGVQQCSWQRLSVVTLCLPLGHIKLISRLARLIRLRKHLPIGYSLESLRWTWNIKGIA